jgi:nitrite reductase (NADH) large subunit
MKIIVVGNNIAGITAAKSIRDLSPDAEIIIFADEAYHYYPRPMLIEFIAGSVPEEKLFMNKPEWYAKNRLDVRLDTKVERIDAAKKAVLAAGAWHGYDRLVLANGASPFVPPIPGLPKKWVLALRTLDDAKRMRARAPDARSTAVIGGGLLGLETANALRRARPGMKVHLIEMGDYLLPRQLDAEGGAILEKMISPLGIDLHPKAEVSSVDGTDEEMLVRLKSGESIEAQLVVVSAGVRPNLQLAKDAGLAVGRGLTVDSGMRCSPGDGIYAAGDVAEFEGRTWGIIPVALEQAKVAARKALGAETPDYKSAPPANTLKVMGIDLTSVGLVANPGAGHEEIRAISPDGNVYKKYVIKDGKLVGAILLGTKKGAVAVQKMVKDGADIAPIMDMLPDWTYELK